MQEENAAAIANSGTTDEEIKELLQEDLELAKENNKLLKRMHRNAMIALAAKALLWLILLGVPLFFLGPYLQPLFSFATTGQIPQNAGTENLFGLPTAGELKQIINAYGGGQ